MYAALRTFHSTENTWPLLLTTFPLTIVATTYYLLYGRKVHGEPQVKVEIVLNCAHTACPPVQFFYFLLFGQEISNLYFGEAKLTEWIAAKSRTSPEPTYQCL